MKKSVDSGGFERLKHESSKGFDTNGNLMKTIAKVAGIAAIAIIVAVVVYTYFSGSESGIAGGQRNCILSVMGNPPDCSDDDGTLKQTFANGRYIGECYGLDNSGNCVK